MEFAALSQFELLKHLNYLLHYPLNTSGQHAEIRNLFNILERGRGTGKNRQQFVNNWDVFQSVCCQQLNSRYLLFKLLKSKLLTNSFE